LLLERSNLVTESSLNVYNTLLSHATTVNFDKLMSAIEKIDSQEIDKYLMVTNFFSSPRAVKTRWDSRFNIL
jgi:hypothetical protein